MLMIDPAFDAALHHTAPRPPQGPGDGDEDELPMGDPPDDDESDDPNDEDEGEEDDEPLHTRSMN